MRASWIFFARAPRNPLDECLPSVDAQADRYGIVSAWREQEEEASPFYEWTILCYPPFKLVNIFPIYVNLSFAIYFLWLQQQKHWNPKWKKQTNFDRLKQCETEAWTGGLPLCERFRESIKLTKCAQSSVVHLYSQRPNIKHFMQFPTSFLNKVMKRLKQRIQVHT